eukprot:jgi/Tetstr1/441872/TSEL_030082.t1
MFDSPSAHFLVVRRPPARKNGTPPANPTGVHAPEGGEQGAQEPLLAELDAADTELEYVDFAYNGRAIPLGLDVDAPRMWTLTANTVRGLAEKRSQAAYGEYLHLGCYAFFSSCANKSMRGALESLSTESPTEDGKATALAELRACYRTHLATRKATRSWLGYLQLAKNGPMATKADRVFAELAHAKFCTPKRIAVSGQLDQLCRAFDDKTLEISLSAAGKARAVAAFAKSTPDKPAPTQSAERRQQRDQAAAARKATATAAAADKAKVTKLRRGPPRPLITDNALDPTTTGSLYAAPLKHNWTSWLRDYPASRLSASGSKDAATSGCPGCFKSDPKPGTNKWRLIIDLWELNKWCNTFKMSYKTLKHLRHMTRAGDWFVSMDLADGYYAFGIPEEDRDFFTVNCRRELWRLACLPMG